MKQNLAIWGVLLLALLLAAVRFQQPLRATVNEFFGPFLEARSKLQGRSRNASRFAMSKVELIEEIDRLSAQIDNESFAERRVRILEAENMQLREQLRLSKALGYRLVTAQILVSDPVNGGRTFMIDRGRTSGLQIGQPVLRDGNLLGRVLEVSDHSAHVLSIADPNCKLSVRIVDTEHHGILFGRGANAWRASPYCVARYMPRDAQYMAGTLVETSAFDAKVPPGLPVGSLARRPEREMIVDVDNLYKTLTVEPFAFTSTTPFVTIVLAGEAAALATDSSR